MKRRIFILSLILSCFIFSNEISKLNEKHRILYKEEIIDIEENTYYEQAESLYFSENYEEAEKYFKLAIENSEFIGESYNFLGTIYEKRGKSDEAIKYFEKSAESGAEIGLYNLGIVYGSNENYEQAIYYYKKLLETGTEFSSESIESLGNIYFILGDYKEAKKYYKLIKNPLFSSSVYSNLGFIYMIEDKNFLAKELYKKAVNEGYEDAQLNLGVAYFRMKNYKKAEEEYKKALKLGINGAYINLGGLYTEQKKYTLAKKYLNKALALEEDKDVLFNLGELYFKQKKYKLAEEYYKKAEEKGSISSLIGLSEVYKKEKQYELSKEYKRLAKERGYVNGEYFSLDLEIK